MKVILSIKPEFAYKIFDGTKRYEFRKAIFKCRQVNTVIVYASSPVRKVIGEFRIARIINHDVDTLWGLTSQFSGISEAFFYDYFAAREFGYAIEIKKATKYRKPKCLMADFNLLPPQSFAYFRPGSAKV